MDLAGTGLSPGSFEILELVAHNPHIGQSRLAQAIGLEKSSLVPAIARLEDLQLIARRTSASDKRAYELRITPKGLKALARLRDYVIERDSEITRGLSADEIATLNVWARSSPT